jgi:carbon starvation protein CstA
MIVLWTGAVYLYRKFPESKKYLVPAIPATFMSVVTSTYILQAEEGFGLSPSITYPAGIVFAIVCVILFVRATVMKKQVD